MKYRYAYIYEGEPLDLLRVKYDEVDLGNYLPLVNGLVWKKVVRTGEMSFPRRRVLSVEMKKGASEK